MPRKGVNKHTTQTGQQAKTEFLKIFKNYKEIIPMNEYISKNLKAFYDSNILNSGTKFEELKEYYDQEGIGDTIAWNERVTSRSSINTPIKTRRL